MSILVEDMYKGMYSGDPIRYKGSLPKSYSYLIPNTIDRFANPEYWQHPETSEDVPQDGPQPSQDP